MNRYFITKGALAKIITILILFFSVHVAVANALTISLSDGSNTITLDDLNGDGVVSWAGTIGVWSLNFTTGLSHPAIGSPSIPHMDLISFDASTTGGILTLTLLDSFGPLDPGISGFISSIGGTICGGGTVTMDTYLDDTLETSLTSLGNMNGLGFSDSKSFLDLPADTNDFDIKMVITINHPNAGYTSFDANVAPVPEPATIMLLGAGLVGIGGWARRRMGKQ